MGRSCAVQHGVQLSLHSLADCIWLNSNGIQHNGSHIEILWIILDAQDPSGTFTKYVAGQNSSVSCFSGHAVATSHLGSTDVRKYH